MTRWLGWMALVGGLFVLGGCAGDEGDDDDDSSVVADDDDDVVADPLEVFFSLAAVHDIEIEVDDQGVESLLGEPREYVTGDVEIDGAALPQIGVRLKGAAGSFVALDGDYPEISGDGNGNPGKSGFIIDFNRYVDGQDHLGLDKLTINNLVQDPSGIHEYLSYALFRQGGVPASRVGYAQVTFNGELKGIYALIESDDNDEFLDGWFGSSDGNLYEGEYGVDLIPEMTEGFDQDNGDDESRQDLQEVAAALDEAGEGDEALEVLQQYFDLDQYLTFAATELYLGHWDGYAQSANNYKIHHALDGDWTFIPWGIDQSFVDTMGRYAGVMGAPGPSWPNGGRVHQVCFDSDECVSMLHTAFEELLDRVDEMDLPSMAEDAADLVEPFVRAEAEAHGDPDATTEAIEGVTTFMEERRDQIEDWLPCLEGGSIDTDGDGHNGCSTDCDDENADIHPGAEEQCNWVDDDCNGVLDDPEECPSCLEEIGPDDSEYALCMEWLSWEDAHQYCIDRGQDLASIHDEITWEILTWGILELMGEWESWIGLNDLEETGNFTWTDGSPLDYAAWFEEAPFEEPDAHCVANTVEGWWNTSCDSEHVFICKGP